MWKKHKDESRKSPWEARTWVNGKRKSRFFKTKIERDVFINENSSSDWIQIQEICGKYDLDPLEIIKNYVKENHSLSLVNSCEAVESFLKWKKVVGVSDDHYLHLKGYLRRFANDMEDRPVNMITKNDVELYLHQANTQVTFRNYRNYLSLFYTWAVENNIVRENLARKVKLPKIEYPEPEFLSVKEARQLLEANKGEKYGVQLALQMFAGLRASTCWQVTYEMINFEEQRILLPAKIMKAGRRHLMENLPDCLWNWLESADPECFNWNFRNWKKHKEKAFERAQVKSRHNVLRHSFATYLCALDQSAERCAYLMSHRNNTVLYQHYKGCATQKEAKQYFKIN